MGHFHECHTMWTKFLWMTFFVSAQVNACTNGPQPLDRQLVLLTPFPPLDLEHEIDLGMARGGSMVGTHTRR